MVTLLVVVVFLLLVFVVMVVLGCCVIHVVVMMIFGNQKRMVVAMFKQTFRANNSGQFEGTTDENVGFPGKKGQKVHPNFAPNITMEFSYHAFYAPE